MRALSLDHEGNIQYYKSGFSYYEGNSEYYNSTVRALFSHEGNTSYL